MDAFYTTHVKLLAFDLLSLTPTSSDPISFSRKGKLLLSRAETVGIVTTRELKPDRFLKFTVDDGTGCIPCILWLNQLSSPYFSRRNPSDVRLIADVAACFSNQIQLGAVVRVRGRITSYRGSVQVTVADVVIERDPNVEILHWLDCVKLARKCYDGIGDAIGKLHDGGLILGDLTTSNMLIRNNTNQLVLIDFGLSFTSNLPEDKAVDLYALERALLSMHSSCGNVMDGELAAYRNSSKQWSSTLNKLAQARYSPAKR